MKMPNDARGTHGIAPPSGALLLFDGGGLEAWVMGEGRAAEWIVSDGILRVASGIGDIMSKALFRDSHLHLEFRCPDMPDKMGQSRGNSGVYLQGRYEIQILDSYGVDPPGKRDCGAVYNQTPPLVNACKPPTVWQTLDVVFRAPREAGSHADSTARVTALQNGEVIHNNVQVRETTAGALDTRLFGPGPLLLQDHGDPVEFRNIWIQPLPLEADIP